MTASSNAFVDYIREEIAKAFGVISFERFMALLLYHPTWGYYCSPTFRLGKEGDFTTAPELSPLFAKCLTKPINQALADLPQKAILELGAGSGRLALDLLKALEAEGNLPERYLIYEISPVLREKQRVFLQSSAPKLISRIEWLAHLPSNFTGVIIANEVLDALPVHRFQVTETGCKEVGITWHQDGFHWKMHETKNDLLLQKAAEITHECRLYPGYTSEINLNLMAYIEAISESLTQGSVLFADYGYGRREYYHPERNNGTLTCFTKHRLGANPLLNPGCQDITAHVDFTLLAESATGSGLTLDGYTTQASFLLENGLMELAAEEEKTCSETDAFRLHQAIKTLTFPTEMGERIKIMALSKNMTNKISAGFNLHDRRRDL